MSTLLVLNTLCMVWRKVIRVFRIWSISSCAVSLFAIAVYFYGPIDAHQILMGAGKNAKKRKKTVDAVAATLILEGYLTYKKSR